MSKKPHHLENLGNIFGSLHKNASPPSPAPLEGAQEAIAPPPPSAPVGRKPVGRPTGKKSDEEYCQTTIHIRKATRKRVKQALLDADNGQDVSELVEELLTKWLETRT